MLILVGAGMAWSQDRFDTEKTPITVTEIAAGLRHPWAIAFLPDGRMLVTERIGKMRIIGRDGTIGSALDGLPEVDARGQGGLLDVAVHPEFAENRLVYWSYAEAGRGRQLDRRGARPAQRGRNRTDRCRGRSSRSSRS